MNEYVLQKNCTERLSLSLNKVNSALISLTHPDDNHQAMTNAQNAVKKLESTDEFEQYSAVKFLVTYGAKDTLNKIIQVMKKLQKLIMRLLNTSQA